ncbi:FtsJ methyltransferase domain-containing protein 1 [Tetrabaena socialis]|uniref:Cap-specific mRNA (nucleoside-2'-O-)-methyltransferase 2 n=1 Tax=Tetrabaena socialis TaxID=47790 RepID=A0A2J8A860_9CHLO|nr:FtsJ methyltransferase domain-containing protein 1 [Tetrabaena socialis]|eukprot:PNH08698.1 FtsJ methyltransferase domain-containing protein 1 [Tetrabaena socialis]
MLWQKAMALLEDRERRIDTSGCVLPADASGFFPLAADSWLSHDDVAPHRDALNEAKGLLDDLDNTAWDRMASDSYYAEYVRRNLRKEFHVELGTVAWAKLYELIVCCELWPIEVQNSSSSDSSSAIAALPAPPNPAGPPAFTVHLCEAPGGFVAATNHYLRTHRPGVAWDWLAVSLNPYWGGNDQYAMVDDDSFMRATLPRWCFGADDSGDIRRPANIAAVWAEARRRCHAVGGASLVTADGAVDTQVVPHAQELVNASLHFCEIVTALGLLAAGGSLVCKVFTLFEHTSLCSLYLVGCLFDTVSVVKPSTSKPANSEVYIVGRGFRGVSEQVLQLLLSNCGEDVFSERPPRVNRRALFARELLPPSFLESALGAARHFASCTSDAIRDALDKAGLPPSGPTATAIRRVKERFAAEWFQRTRLLRLERRFFVAPHESLDGTSNNTSNVLGRRRELLGTLAERKEQYRRRRCDLGLDGGALLAAAAGCTSLGSSPGGLGSSSNGGGRAGGSAGWRGGGAAGDIAGAVGAAGGGGCGGGDEEDSASPSRLGLKLMAKMGYKEGSGLGRNGQGPIAALSAMGNSGRAGLGLAGATASPPPPAPLVFPAGDAAAPDHRNGASWTGCTPGLGWGSSGSCTAGLGTAVAAEAASPPRESWRLAPDANALLNDRPLAAAEVASWAADAAAASVGHGPSPQHSRGTSLLRQQAPPARLTKSKMVVDDTVMVALRRVRDAFEAAPGSAPTGPAPRKKLCAHTGPTCLAPRRLGAGAAGRSFWKLASLDAALSICAAAALSAAMGGAAPRALDLALHGAGATDFLLHAAARSLPAPRNAGSSAGAPQRRSSSCSLSSARSSSDGAAGVRGGAGAAAPWSCTMLATDAAAAYAQQLGPDARSRLHLQPLAGLAPPPADPLSPELFTSETSRSVVAAATAAAAAAEGGAGSLHLVVGDLGNLRRAHCGRPPSSQLPCQREYDTLYRRRLLWEAATALGALEVGGCAVLRLGDSLTMFSASLLYLLHRSFGRLTLVKPFASCACSPERFVVLVGRLEDGGVAVGQLLAGLEAVRQVEVAPAGPPAIPLAAGSSSSACAEASVSPEASPAAARGIEAVSAPAAPLLAKPPPLVCAAAATPLDAALSPTAELDADAGGSSGSSGVAATTEASALDGPACSQASRAPLAPPAASPTVHCAAAAAQEGPMVLTGVAPLTECVAGGFYQYLAARTQELARRQVRACEAALTAQTGAQRGGGCARAARYSSGEKAEHLAIARRAEAVLAGELMVEEQDGDPLNLEGSPLDLIFTRGTQASAAGPASAAACWPSELDVPTAGLGFIAASAGPRAGRSGASIWASTPYTGHPEAGAGSSARVTGFASPGRHTNRGGRGGARPPCSADDGLHRTSSSWRSAAPPASSYGASPPSAFFAPWGANSPSGASTPYGTSPILGKSPLYGHSLPGPSTGPSPPPHGSSWHARTSAPWGAQHHARQGPDPGSAGWERSGVRAGGAVAGGLVPLDVAAEGACGVAAVDMPPAGASGNSSYGSGRAAFSAGGSRSSQGAPVKLDGGSWRSSGKWQAQAPVAGPIVTRAESPLLEEDEEGWERVVGTGRRRAHQFVPRA